MILVGHGAAPADCPRELVAELKALEGRRQAQGGFAAPMSPREAELDARIRSWPRTPANDPYQAGLEDIARQLRMFLGSAPVVAAFNEFCAPSVEEAAERLVKAGCSKVSVATVMLTRGGLHSELEIPAIVAKLKALHPKTEFAYAWPYDNVQVAELIARQLRRY